MTALLGEMAHLMFAEMVFIFTLFPTDIALQHWEWVEEDDWIDGRLLWLRTGAGLRDLKKNVEDVCIRGLNFS